MRMVLRLLISMISIITSNILSNLYQSFGFALIMSILFMFVWKDYCSLKEATTSWISRFKSEVRFRRVFVFTFYTAMILFRTLLNRSMWANPVSDVIGVWGLYKYDASKDAMVLTTEVPENLLLFVPWAVLLLWVYREKILGDRVTLGKVLWQSTKIVFLFSFTIEMLQLFLRLGTWQLSDLFYNTLGGFIGGLIYWVGYKLKNLSERKSGLVP